MNLNQQIKSLELAIAELPDKEEAADLIQQVWQAKEELNESGYCTEIDETLHLIGQRINYLMENT